MPEDYEERIAVCALAAAQLARRQRQMEVVEQAVELVADSPFHDLSLTLEQAAAVLQKEKVARAFPTPNRPGPDYDDFLDTAFGMFPLDDFDEDEDDFDLDDIPEGTPLPPDRPPEVARILFDEVGKAVQRGESLDSLLNRLIGSGAGFGGKRKKGRRR